MTITLGKTTKKPAPNHGRAYPFRYSFAALIIMMAVGSHAWAQSPVKVASRVSGVVKSIEVKEGQKVAKGDILARLDDALARVDVKKAEAELESTRARALEAKRNLEREEVLAKRGLIPPAELEDAQTKSAAAKGDFQSAEARLEEARLNLEYTSVRSPVSGRIAKTLTYEGQVIRLDVEVTTLFEISADGR
jgi:RND family efflux transporter MFP subunit